MYVLEIRFVFWHAAVSLTPQQQKGTRRSPILLTTLVLGMRRLCTDAGLTEKVSEP